MTTELNFDLFYLIEARRSTVLKRQIEVPLVDIGSRLTSGVKVYLQCFLLVSRNVKNLTQVPIVWRHAEYLRITLQRPRPFPL